jgi:hypothetical protein
LQDEVKKVNKKKKKVEIEEEDPYNADDEDDDFSSKKRRSLNESRLVMKVVKQGDYQHKQSNDGRSGLGDVEQDFFLPRNLTHFQLKSSDDDSWEDFDEDYDEDEEKPKNVTKIDRPKTKAVFEAPRKPLANYSKWSKWTKCSPKCVTRRFKKCRPHARNACGNDIIREIAYCYTEGSFCEEWISSQISKIGVYNAAESPKSTTTTTTKAPRGTGISRRTESPLTNTVSQNFYGPNERKNKMNPEFKPQNFQCGFPSIRNKNSDFALKIIGGKTSRRAQVRKLFFFF